MATMRFSQLTCITALLTLQPLVSQPASFDCSKAITPAEKGICANPDLGRLDQEIADAYKQLLAKAEDPFKKYVKVAQRAWLKSRRNPKTLAETMQARLKELNASFYRTNDLTFLRLMGDQLPMFLLTKLPGTDRYNQWAAKEWEVAPYVYTAEEDEKARTECNDTGDCEVVVTQLYQINAVSSEILSVNKSASTDGFGAHPANEDINYHWWLSRSGEIKPSDIFTNNHYADIIALAVKKYYAENFDGQSGNGDGLKIALNPNNWAITAQSLHITGQGYDFGVGRGYVEIDVPWKDFGEVVAPHFIDIIKGIR